MVENIWQPAIRLDLQIEPDLPTLTCSRINLQGAIMNLLANARDAMPGGGTISLAARPIAKSGHTMAVEIEVMDEGVGMSPDTLQRAFEPFFTTRATGLGGFGLPVVKRFVEDIGGQVAVKSRLATGTRVILRLPI
ncbi:sensor histidine kinase [Mycoplana rhizolycopersici]|uniref:histidine kinase n=1 Tax=Mycoplana rhizolycopersici TaxID=2746702 RepID=A0ABX2QN63_9HYPH|nr:ATP-binding protein [Rhizobium rhizolycopersici]NVP58324.1 ATP-binding protein [Rhizobium rhizolycopersici]